MTASPAPLYPRTRALGLWARSWKARWDRALGVGFLVWTGGTALAMFVAAYIGGTTDPQTGFWHVPALPLAVVFVASLVVALIGGIMIYSYFEIILNHRGVSQEHAQLAAELLNLEGRLNVGNFAALLEVGDTSLSMAARGLHDRYTKRLKLLFEAAEGLDGAVASPLGMAVLARLNTQADHLDAEISSVLASMPDARSFEQLETEAARDAARAVIGEWAAK